MEWINVKDRLPENNDRVIILSLTEINDYSYPYNYNDACEMGFYEKGKWFSETRFDILDHTKEAPVSWQDIEGVTHWMPLPDLPTD